jgi:Flp pilus assembly protein TadG
MIMGRKSLSAGVRSGVAAVEFAVVAPFLVFICLIAVDWARVFYYTVVLENCARNGAYYASNYGLYDYQNPPDAAIEDTTNLSPAPTITIMYSSSSSGPYNLTTPPISYLSGGAPAYVQVTAAWTFTTVANFSFFPWFGIPNSTNLQRSVEMEMAPLVPAFS